MRKDFDTKRGAVVTPLPVLLVGTYDADGTPNLMNVAWGGQCSERHIAINIGHVRKTLENIKLKGAFTVSFATPGTLVAADYVGIVSGLKEPQKISKAGLHHSRSARVDAPIFDELPLALECILDELAETKTGEIRITGEVVGMSADETILDADGKIDIGLLRPIIFDSAQNLYRVVGDAVGRAFHEGIQMK